jgi:hypothetical protein
MNSKKLIALEISLDTQLLIIEYLLLHPEMKKGAVIEKAIRKYIHEELKTGERMEK